MLADPLSRSVKWETFCPCWTRTWWMHICIYQSEHAILMQKDTRRNGETMISLITWCTTSIIYDNMMNNITYHTPHIYHITNYHMIYHITKYHMMYHMIYHIGYHISHDTPHDVPYHKLSHDTSRDTPHSIPYLVSAYHVVYHHISHDTSYHVCSTSYIMIHSDYVIHRSRVSYPYHITYIITIDIYILGISIYIYI